MARKVLTNAEMQAIILAGGSVLINCRTHTTLATSISQLPDDNEILECFPLVPYPEFDQDDLNSNAIGILGYFFSGTPTDGDGIRFNHANNVWEFVPMALSGITQVTEGGTGLSTIPANSILYSTALDTLSSTTLGNTLLVSSGILNVLADSHVQKIEISGNNNLFGTRKRINFVNGSNTTVTVTDDPTNNKTDVIISASGVAGTRWDQLADPVGNLTLNHGSSNTVLSWGNATAANSLLQLKDSNNNSGNGHILDINSSVGSNINIFRATATGQNNGIQMDNTGKLLSIGTGNIEASLLKGLSGTGIPVKIASGFISRSIVSTSSDITITNPDGVSGNITLGLSGNVVSGITNDTNVSGSVSGNILTLGWSGQLSKTRQNASTVYNDQSNSYVSGNKQNFSPNNINAGLNVGFTSTNPTTLSNGDVWGNSTTGKIKFYEQGEAYDLLQLVRGIKNLTDGVSVSVFEVDLPHLTATAMILNYAIYASDGTNIQVRSGSIRFSGANKSGSIVAEKYIDTEGVAPSIGSLTVFWDIVAGGNKITVKALADTSLTANTLYVIYSVDNLSDRPITKL